MRFGHPEDWLARRGVSLSNDSSSALPKRVRRLVREAINIIWAFYNSPLQGGVQWAASEAAENLAAFSSVCLQQNSHLVEMCRDLRGHDAVAPEEAEVLSAIVEIAEVFRQEALYSATANWESEGCLVPGSFNDGTLCEQAHAELATGLRADFRIERVQYRVKLRNLSAAGVMVVKAPRSCEGMQARIGLRGGAWVDGSVVWSLEDRCGFAFADPSGPLVEFMRRLFAQGHLDC